MYFISFVEGNTSAAASASTVWNLDGCQEQHSDNEDQDAHLIFTGDEIENM